MIFINGKTYSGQIQYNANYKGDLSATFDFVPTEDEILSLISQNEIREVSDRGELIAVYSLIKWRSVEIVNSKLRILWQTYVYDEINSIRSDNEDLTQALLELAEIVGGNNG